MFGSMAILCLQFSLCLAFPLNFHCTFSFTVLVEYLPNFPIKESILQKSFFVCVLFNSMNPCSYRLKAERCLIAEQSLLTCLLWEHSYKGSHEKLWSGLWRPVLPSVKYQIVLNLTSNVYCYQQTCGTYNRVSYVAPRIELNPQVALGVCP